MAADKKLDLKTAKLALKVSRSALTKANSETNLKPNYLDKQASHLEVCKFCQSVDVYIHTGFRDTPPQKVWPYIRPLMHVTWSNNLELNGVKEKYLAETPEIQFTIAELTS